MDDRELDAWKERLRQSVDYFAGSNKATREVEPCADFLLNLGIEFEPAELQPELNDPPDMIFRDARFELTETLDPGRRRHAEYKHALAELEATGRTDHLSTTFAPIDMTPTEIGLLAHDAARAKRYGPREREQLDLLVYIDLLKHSLVAGPFPEPTAFADLGWRSISALRCWCSLVFYAAPTAPAFLRACAGRATERRFK